MLEMEEVHTKPAQNIPPPPPFELILACNTNKETLKDKLASKYIGPNTWHEECGNVIGRRILEKNDGDNKQNHFYSQNCSVNGMVQDGPQCGLVALCMAGEMMRQAVAIDDVVQTAKAKMFTKQGEMFSACEMLELAQFYLKCSGKVVKDEERKLNVLQSLQARCPVLVPYDRDHNHEPCMKDGRKAHWAVLTGFMLKTSTILHEPSSGEIQHDDQLKNLYIISSNRDCPNIIYNKLQSADPTDIYVYARQGKSLRIHLWSLDDLLRSNSQLTDLGETIQDNKDDYMIPPGGIADGLNDNMLILYNK